ncbi:TRAP transporter large permease subunit [Bacillus subtilis]|uniref:TRAP transporter large permease n=1 Tax=Pseudochrobactrum asaccharolyticum TaxID=354351 RepID=UPI001F00C2B9|nr:TRAP transporter large permease subunit [Pseudochrobactrum asaccharolyticum]MCF7644130.1 TRAP transporter large permease subunit [Pseudochrobactrum asaccharolyticum]MCF7670631.1 TRAP transporter large permease subunit [Bacillus subtilis]
MSTVKTYPAVATTPVQSLARIILAGIETMLGAICATLLAALLLIVLTTVVLRYGFNTGLLGSEELATWLYVALIAFGAPLAINSALAMRLDLVTSRLSPAGQRVTAVCADVFTLMSGLILSFGSARIASLLGGISPTLGLPEWIRFGFLGLGGFFIVIVLGLQRISENKTADVLIAGITATVLYIAVSHSHIDTDLSPSIVLGLIALAGLLVAAPLPHAFLAGAYIAIAFGSTLPEPAVVSSTVTGVSKFLLLAIPFFLLAGSLLTAAGIAQKIVHCASSLVGHRRAGLAQTTLLTSVLFSGASGSSVANAAFSSATFQPELVKRGYPPAQAGAIIAATSVLDNVIPPSIAFLILAAATNLSVGALLVGGFAAGAVMAVCLAVAIHLTVKEQVAQPRASGRERVQAAIGAIPAFGLGIIVVVGIRMGVVTTTEAAAIAAIYTLVMAVIGKVGITSLYDIFKQSGKEASAIGLLIGTASPFAFLLAVDDISGTISDLVNGFGANPIVTLIIINLVLLVVGLVLDIGAAILLFGPIFLPIAIAAGIDPVMFGVILVVNLMIGGLTPPVGMLVFVVSGVTRLPATALFKAMTPYFIALLFSLVILGAWALLI